jgi:hypothetical protein
VSGHADNPTLRWSCNYPSHEHQSWEDADCCDMATTLMVNPNETYSRIYAQLGELYESAGQPEGQDEADLWRWIGKICMP